MLGKIWKKALLFILIVACLFNIVRKLVRKTSIKEELQATLDYFNARNQKTQENIIENNANTQPNNEKTIEQNYNQIIVENNQMIQQPTNINSQQIQQPNTQINQQNQQQVTTNNQDVQQTYTTNNPNEQPSNGQTTQDLIPITQSEIEQNMQVRMQGDISQQLNQ